MLDTCHTKFGWWREMCINCRRRRLVFIWYVSFIFNRVIIYTGLIAIYWNWKRKFLYHSPMEHYPSTGSPMEIDLVEPSLQPPTWRLGQLSGYRTAAVASLLGDDLRLSIRQMKRMTEREKIINHWVDIQQHGMKRSVCCRIYLLFGISETYAAIRLTL